MRKHAIVTRDDKEALRQQPTLFSDQVTVSDGFLGQAILYQGDYAQHYVMLKFLYPLPESLREILRNESKWFASDLYRENESGYFSPEIWQSYDLDQWNFAQCFLEHPDNIRTLDDYNRYIESLKQQSPGL